MPSVRILQPTQADALLIADILTRTVSAQTVIDELAADFGESKVESYRRRVAEGTLITGIIKDLSLPKSRTLGGFDDNGILRGFARFYKHPDAIWLLMIATDKRMTVAQRLEAFRMLMAWGARNIDALTLATEFAGETKDGGRIDNQLKNILTRRDPPVGTPSTGFVVWRATAGEMRTAFGAP